MIGLPHCPTAISNTSYDAIVKTTAQIQGISLIDGTYVW